MADRNEWLSLSREEALEPDRPICDPHHHLWEYPTSRYLLEEFLKDLSGGHNVVSTVFVECVQKYREKGPEQLRPLGETEFVEDATAGHAGIAAGIVGFADLAVGVAVAETLEAHLAVSPRFRGIRHATAWHASDQLHNAHTRPPEGLLLDNRFRQGFALLERYELSFDAWLYHTQLAELVDLAHAFPGTSIVLDHMAGPAGIGPFAGRDKEVFKAWRAGLEQLARCENVTVKLGGRAMTLSGFGWHKREEPPHSGEMAQAMAPFFHACIDLFGPDRCMFESNFPVDRASCSYTALWNAYKRFSAEFGEAERNALFHDTASRVYRLVN